MKNTFEAVAPAQEQPLILRDLDDGYYYDSSKSQFYIPVSHYKHLSKDRIDEFYEELFNGKMNSVPFDENSDHFLVSLPSNVSEERLMKFKDRIEEAMEI